MKKYKRIFTIVMDSLGIGAMPDAASYGDAGTDTLGHISDRMETLTMPNLQKIGMANLHPLKQVAPAEHPMGYYMTLKEASTGKDTMTGHWEMMGLHITKPFQTFTGHGFPKERIEGRRSVQVTRLSETRARAERRSLTSWQRKRSQPAT